MVYQMLENELKIKNGIIPFSLAILYFVKFLLYSIRYYK